MPDCNGYSRLPSNAPAREISDASEPVTRIDEIRVPFDVHGLAGRKSFAPLLVQLAQGLIGTNQIALRSSGLFATHQRWLLWHAVFAHYFKLPSASNLGHSRRIFPSLAMKHGICADNTAYALFDDALDHGVMEPIGAADNRGWQEVVPTAKTTSLLFDWYRIHVEALDRMDGGDRADWLMANPGRALFLVQAEVADGLLSTPELRNPGPLHSIFTWADAGGLLMDRLMAGLEIQAVGRQERLPSMSCRSYRLRLRPVCRVRM